MAVKQVRATEIDVACVECGKVSCVSLESLVADIETVVLPWCGHCGKTCTTLHVVPGIITKSGAGVTRQAVNKSLHAELIRRGQVTDGAKSATVRADLYDGAMVWPVGDDVIDVPLPPFVARVTGE